MLETSLTQMLHLRYPIIQAGMAGGPTTPELVAAVSNAGGLGTLGAAYLDGERILATLKQIRERTDKPFGVNLFCPETFEVNPADIQTMHQTLNKYRNRYGIPHSPAITKFEESFEEQFQAIVAARVPVCSFTFGIPQRQVIERLKAADICVMGTATTVHEAVQLEAAGVDAIIAQGSEAGGHRGTFAHAAESALIGTMALIPQVVDHVALPVIAAGGIMDGRGLAASLMLGAAGVQMGTAFLACPESGAHPRYKEVLQQTTEEQTAITKAYSGKAARGVETEFMRQMANCAPLPPYPVQNALTRDIRQAAAKANDSDCMSLWAGQGIRLVNPRPAAQVVEETARRATDAMRAFT